MVSKFYYNEDACLNLANGAVRLTGLMEKTYGPLGSHIILGNPLSVPVSVQSGNGIIQEIDLSNPGTELAKEAIIKMADTEGDGTTTAAILLGNLVKGAVRMSMAGVNPVRLRTALNKESERVCTWLKSGARNGLDVKTAAGLVAAGDQEAKELICRAFEKVTADGIVTVRDSKNVESHVEVLNSIEIDQGYLSEEMITGPAGLEAVLEYPYILLTDQVISKSEMIVPAMNLARKAGKSLFIMAQDITGEALATLVVNIRNKKLRTVAVKATAYGERRKEILGDLAAAAGAAVISGDLGERLEDVSEFHFGTASQVRVTAGHTYVSGGKGNPEILKARISRIRAEIESAAYEVDKVNLRNRLARLEGGIAVIHVGAPTETEMRSRRQKIKSAAAAVKAIAKQGAAAGGGIALFDAACELYGEGRPAGLDCAAGDRVGENGRFLTESRTEEEKTAAFLMKEMLEAPLVRLLANSDCSPYEVIDRLKTMPPGHGYDVVKKQYGTMFEMGIMDGAGTLCRAVETAVSLTGLIITAGAVLRDESLLKTN